MNKEQLTLERTTPYLPYGLKLSIDGEDHTYTMVDYEGGIYNISIGKVINSWINGEEKKRYKPILRPLSQLTEEIEHNGEKFVPLYAIGVISGIIEDQDVKTINEMVACYEKYYEHGIKDFAYSSSPIFFQYIEGIFYYGNEMVDYNQFKLTMKLIEWKFDVSGLIEKKLAIDVTTLETNPYK